MANNLEKGHLKNANFIRSILFSYNNYDLKTLLQSPTTPLSPPPSTEKEKKKVQVV